MSSFTDALFPILIYLFSPIGYRFSFICSFWLLLYASHMMLVNISYDFSSSFWVILPNLSPMFALNAPESMQIFLFEDVF